MSLAERIIGFLLLLAAGLLAVFGADLPLVIAVGFWAGLLIAGAVLLRRTWQALFGPVFFYDLIRTSRRGRYFALRCGYAAGLLLVLFVHYGSWFRGLDLEDLFRASALRPADAARFADGFFTQFLIGQFAAALVLTPLLTAGAITEEKEKRTFEFLLTTELHNREIVLGKLGSRLSQLTLLVFTGLPVLGLLQFLGGVDPELVLAGSLATALTVVSVASLGIAVSVLSRTTAGAVFSTYLYIVVYLIFTVCLGCCAHEVPFLNFGNPLLAFVQLESAWSHQPVFPTPTSRSPTDVLAQVLIGYGVSHVVLALGCGLLAMRRLRRPALEESRKRPLAPFELPPRDEDRIVEIVRPIYRRRPPIGGNALWWKEANDQAIRMAESPRNLLGCFVLFTTLGSILCLLLFAAEWSMHGWPPPGALESLRALNVAVRFLGTALACLMLVLVVINAAGRVSREWEQQTLEGLLTLPIERHEILASKWLASILHVRGLWWFLGWFWLMALLSGGPTFWHAPFLIAWWWVFAAFAAALGMWFSVLTRSTLRATLWAPLAVLAVPAGAWAVLEYAIQLMTKEGSNPGLIAAAEQFQAYGLSPPMALWALSASGADGHIGHFLAAVAGMGFYFFATVLVAVMTRHRFRMLIGETPESAPKGP